MLYIPSVQANTPYDTYHLQHSITMHQRAGIKWHAITQYSYISPLNILPTRNKLYCQQRQTA